MGALGRFAVPFLGLLILTAMAAGQRALGHQRAGGIPAPAPTAAFSVILAFAGNSAKDGANPRSGLIADKTGTLYGTTEYGGGSGACKPRTLGCGTVFSLEPAKAGKYTERILHEFTGFSDGAYPLGGLALQNGDLFGTTSSGSGKAKYGTVFALIPSGSGYAKKTLYSFKGSSDDDGAQPVGQLIADASGNLYGTTYEGGSGCEGTGCGIVFELQLHGSHYVETVLHRFIGSPGDGSHPNAGLVMDGNGVLYGTTVYGGSGTFCLSGCGTAFAVHVQSSSSTEQVLYNFQSGIDGAFPYARLHLGGGVLYGTTAGGGYACSGGFGCGTVFELVPGSSAFSERVVYRFRGGPDGAAPESRLVEGAHGVFYGTTTKAGNPECRCGTIYQLTPAGSLYQDTILHTFTADGSDGAFAYGDLITRKSGAILGSSYGGGLVGLGTVFEVKP